MNDLIGYEPTTVATFEIDHAVRGDTEVFLGMGSTSSPTATKDFVSPGYFTDIILVSISPIASGDFVSGVWTGTVTVDEIVDDRFLFADLGNGVQGGSSTFDVREALEYGDAPSPDQVAQTRSMEPKRMVS